MSSHLDNLEFYIPNIKKLRVLDVGAGRGKFLIECAEADVNAKGIEYNPENVRLSIERGRQRNINIDNTQGQAENLPFNDSSFDFINLSEVIEHVLSPEKVLLEVYRVLSDKGSVYVSVPNRFGWFDHHFHLAFVNWLPRSLSDWYIGLFGKHKAYKGESGLQRLSEMHYHTFKGFMSEAYKAGFDAKDMRVIKIKSKFKNPVSRVILLPVYIFLRFWYFESFHFLLIKKYAKN
jgi:2-polyprenyl-3-methyl-5-hydroxy-6-metoxy-1,4-benzoquinol methylase